MRPFAFLHEPNDVPVAFRQIATYFLQIRLAIDDDGRVFGVQIIAFVQLVREIIRDAVSVEIIPYVFPLLFP